MRKEVGGKRTHNHFLNKNTKTKKNNFEFTEC